MLAQQQRLGDYGCGSDSKGAPWAPHGVERFLIKLAKDVLSNSHGVYVYKITIQ